MESERVKEKKGKEEVTEGTDWHVPPKIEVLLLLA